MRAQRQLWWPSREVEGSTLVEPLVGRWLTGSAAALTIVHETSKHRANRDEHHELMVDLFPDLH